MGICTPGEVRGYGGLAPRKVCPNHAPIKSRKMEQLPLKILVSPWLNQISFSDIKNILDLPSPKGTSFIEF